MGGVDGSIAPMVTPETAARELRENTTDGAAVLARRAISLLSSFLAGAGGDDLWAQSRLFAESLRDARPAMAAVGNLVQYWMDTLPPQRDDYRCCAIAHCGAVLARADRALDKTVRTARARLAAFAPGSTILIHSASSTVRSVVANLPLGIVATASEPGGEGRRMAAELGVHCVEDEDAPAVVVDVAAVVVGADALGRQTFVNKVGTRTLARAARSSSTSFFVVAESYKSVAQPRPRCDEVGFEAIPNDLVTAFLTDQPAEFPLCCTP